jgi:branched-chain amino acid transport system substrate-binding protein
MHFGRHRLRGRFLAMGTLCLAVLLQAQLAQGQILPDRIRLGLIGSVTGPQAGASLSPQVGARMAVAEINRAGGIAGKQVDIVSGDDQSNPAAGVAEAKRLVYAEKVNVVIGPNSSQFTLAIAPTLNEAKIASISTSGSIELTPAVAPYHFSILPPADAQSRTMLAYASQRLKAKSVAWFSDNGAQSKAALKTLQAEAGPAGVTITGIQEFEIGSTDMTPQLLALRRSRPDVLLTYTNTGGDQGHLAKGLSEIGWKVPEVAGQSATYLYAAALKIAPNAFDNMVSVGITALSYCSKDPIGQNEFARFRDKIKAFDPGRFDQLSHTSVAWGYDAVYIMKAAIEGTRSTDGPVIARWMEQHVGEVKAISGRLEATPGNHFLFASPGALSMIEKPQQMRADGLVKRAGC